MNVIVLKECGYEFALIGVGLSYGLTSEMSLADFFNSPEVYDRCEDIAQRLATKDGGHNKLLEAITVWLDIDAPRYWWQQEATYRAGISRQSESTIHTILKQPLEQTDFEYSIHPEILRRLNTMIANRDLDHIKANLPEGFLQRRIVTTNYKVLRHIYQQRKTHRLKEWHYFCQVLDDQLRHPEFLK